MSAFKYLWHFHSEEKAFWCGGFHCCGWLQFFSFFFLKDVEMFHSLQNTLNLGYNQSPPPLYCKGSLKNRKLHLVLGYSDDEIKCKIIIRLRKKNCHIGLIHPMDQNPAISQVNLSTNTICPRLVILGNTKQILHEFCR